MKANRILVTGANGFIGLPFCEALEHLEYRVNRVVRFSSTPNKNNSHKKNKIYEININQNTDWGDLLENIDYVVHLAGRAHIIRETEQDPQAAFRDVNTLGTGRLARSAAKWGVKRFVYISSIGVNGNLTQGSSFAEDDNPRPHNAYAKSKQEAEQLLHNISMETSMEVVIVRPPLVYGPGVKANFLRLLRMVDRNIPLPLASVHNLRSFISLDNLVDFLILCLKHPAAAGEAFLISDGEDISTPELIKKIAAFMDQPTRFFPFPPKLLHFGAKLLGKEQVVDRLCGSLQIDISKARQVLGWKPSVSVDEGLKATVDWYLQNKK